MSTTLKIVIITLLVSGSVFAQRPDREKIIISGEGLGPLNRSSIKKLKFFLEQNNCNIQIFTFYRDPYNKLVSKFQQTSKVSEISSFQST